MLFSFHLNKTTKVTAIALQLALLAGLHASLDYKITETFAFDIASSVF